MAALGCFAFGCFGVADVAPVSGAGPGAGEGPDWDALAGVEVIRAWTVDPDGDPRETKIWFAVVDGQGFIGTGGSRWGDNLERDPDLVLRIEGRDYPLRADPIENTVLRGRIETAFRDKYGWTDAWVGFFRGNDPRIFHMLPR